jgi:lipoate-protein ligase A
MFTFLRVPWAKTCIEVINVAKNKITSIKKELGKTVSVEEVNNALSGGFEKALNIQLLEGELTPYENEIAKKLYKEKYTTDDWNFHGRNIHEK